MARPAGRREDFVVRILRRGGDDVPVGTGFLVDDERVLTCAHVVNEALGRDRREQDAPDTPVRIDFPTLGGGTPQRVCRVAGWEPPATSRTAGGDVAVLTIVDEVAPAGARAARLAEELDLVDVAVAVAVYGTPGRPARPEGVWSAAIVDGPVGGDMLQVSTDHDETLPMQPGFSGSPLVHVDADGGHWVVGMLVATSERHRDGQAVPVSRLLAATPGLAGVPPSPYRGLATFTARDAPWFIGREDEVADLRERVERSPLTAVIGASGVGKSSLVEAGLVPAWRSAGAVAVRVLCSATATAPDRLDGVLGDIAATLRDVLGDLPLDELRAGAPALVARRAAARERRVLIHLDQFEQLLDAVPHDDLLAALLPDPRAVGADTACRVVVSLRADFVAPLVASGVAGPRLQDRWLTLSPMSVATLTRVVTEPAEHRGVAFEDGLAERVAADAGATAGGLCLMQFCLERLWGTQRDHRLTHAAYEGIGGVAGGLDAHARALFPNLADDPRWAGVRTVLLALVRTRGGADDAIAREVPLTRLGDHLDAVAELGRARLVTVSDEERREVVTLAHETIIRAWEDLRVIVARDADFQHWAAAVGDRLAEDELLPAERLERAEGFVRERRAAVPDEVVDLVARSRDAVDRRRARRTRVRAALAALVVLALALTAVVVVSTSRLTTARDTANARTLGRLAQDRVATDPSAGAQLALAAVAADPEQPDARTALGAAFLARRSTTAVRTAPDGAAVSAVSVDSEADVAVLQTAAGLRLAEGLGGDAPRFGPVPGSGPTTGGAFVAGRGRWVVLADTAGGLRVWDRAGPGPPRDVAGSGADVGRATPDGAHFLVGTPGPAGTTTRLLDLASASATPLATVPEVDPAGLWLTADPRRLLVRAGDGGLTLRDAASGAELSALPPETRVAADGTLLVRCVPAGDDATLEVSDAASGVPRLRVGGPDESPCSGHPALTADGRHVAWTSPASPSAVDLVQLLDVVDGRRSAVWVPRSVGVDPSSPASGRRGEPLEVFLGRQVSPTLLSALSVHGDRALALDGTRLDTLAPSAAPTWRPPAEAARTIPVTVGDGAATVVTRSDGGATAVRTADGAPLGELAPVGLGLGPGESVVDRVLDPGGTSYELVTAAADGLRVRDYELPSFRPRGVLDLPPAGADRFPGPEDAAVVAAAGDRTVVLAGGVLSWWSTGTHRLLAPPLALARDPAGATALVTENRSGIRITADGATVALLDPAQPGGVTLWTLGSDRPVRFTADLMPGGDDALAFAPGRLVTLEQPGVLVQRDPATGAVRGAPVPLPPASTTGILGADRAGGFVTFQNLDSTTAIGFWDLDTRQPTGRLVLPFVPTPKLADGRLDLDLLEDVVQVPVDPAVWREHLCAIEDRPFTDAERALLPAGADTGPPCS